MTYLKKKKMQAKADRNANNKNSGTTGSKQ